MARSLLVTGAAGFIGANFVHYWARAHPEDSVVAYDALTYAGNVASLQALAGSDNFRFVHADICDYDRVLATLREHRWIRWCILPRRAMWTAPSPARMRLSKPMWSAPTAC